MASVRAGIDASLKQIAELLEQYASFVLALHLSPDGDSIGSTLALGSALEQLGKSVDLVRVDPIPKNFNFLPGVHGIVPYEEFQENGPEPELLVLVDCGDLDRIGPAKELAKTVKGVVNIDHHESNTRFGDFNFVDPGAAAAGLIVRDLIESLSADMTPEIAGALYTAVVTDTGSFRYENTDAAVHSMAAEMIEAGARPVEVAGAIFENRSLTHLRLLGEALKNLELSSSGRVAWTRLDRSLLERLEAQPGDTDGIVNYPRRVEGVQVAFLLLEQEDGSVKVSLRSKEPINVSELARAFGGGGHPRAAGCILKQGLDETASRVRSACEEAVRKTAGRDRGGG